MKSLYASLLLLLSLPASALTVSPMAQTLDQSASTGTLRIKSDEATTLRYQVMVDAWTVGPNGEKVMTPSTNLAFYPATVITLGPGKIQTLRWKRTGSMPGKQQVYFITVKPLDPPTTKAVINGASVLIGKQMGMAWTFTSPGLAPVLSAKREGANLVFHNAGNASARLSDIRYGGSVVSNLQLVLPGETLKLPVKASASTVDFVMKDAPHSLPVE